MTLLSPVLFFAADIHLQEMASICVDGIIHPVTWNQFISKLSTEWQEFTLFVSLLSFYTKKFLISPFIRQLSF